MHKVVKPLYVLIAERLMVMRENPDIENRKKAEGEISRLCRNFMPAGNGFDGGTKFDEESSKAHKRLVFLTAFHHMNDVGMYDGWSDHSVIVEPDFGYLSIRVTGRNRNDIKPMMIEMFDACLTRNIVVSFRNGRIEYELHNEGKG